MAGDWPHLPAYQSESEAAWVTPSGWSPHQIDSLFKKLSIGKRFDQKSSLERGRIPVVDQSSDGFVGFHDEAAGVNGSPTSPVVTFANHTCEMRVMRRPFSVIQNVFPMIGRHGVCDTLFLYYSTNGRVHIEEYKGHYPDYRRLWIPLPPLSEQRRIAHILGTLDDKIELNSRMNATLEGISRAIFKSWFVDFDPVRQKAAGQQPIGIDAQTAAMFPDSFEDSEIGEVPKGWGVETLLEYADLNPESWNKSAYPDEVWYVDLSSTKWGEVQVVEKHQRESAPSRAQRILRRGDTIFGTVRPGNGSFAMVDEDGLTGSTGFAVMRPRRREYLEYVYLATTVAENIDRLAHLADGGAYPAVRPEVVADTPAVVVPPPVVERFSQCTSRVFSRIAANRRESRTLAALRDTLLPKLLSGEVRVPEAEEAVEEVLR